MTSKQRAYLRSLSNKLDTLLHIGKSGLTPEFTESVSEALNARELIKIDVLNNCNEDPKDLSHKLSERTKSHVVQVIGRKIVLYKEIKDKPVIQLPQ